MALRLELRNETSPPSRGLDRNLKPGNDSRVGMDALWL
jgi:hypothetical protein